jgi:hypothetical protein
MKKIVKKLFNNLLNFFGILKIKLIREDSHGNDIKVSYISKNKIFRKVTNTPYGQMLLDRENRGFQWYANRINKGKSAFIKNFIKSQHYCSIDIKQFDGIKINYENSLILNYRYLNKFMFYYCKTWPQKKLVPCHGDMTFDNLIFKKNKIFIIDWEHFKKSGEQWGFDLAYLILSAASFPYYRYDFLPEKDQKILNKLWKKLNLLGLRGKIRTRPIDVFKKTFENKIHWQKIIRRSPKKLFPYLLSKRFINHLHSIIN